MPGRFALPLRRLVGVLVVAALYAFLLAPLVVVALASLDGGKHSFFNFPPRHISLAWYTTIPGKYWQTLGTSFLLAIAAAAAGCLLGVPAALGLARSRFFGKEVVASLFRAPLQIPFVVTGVAFLQVYYLISDFAGLNLTDNFFGLALAHTFLATPYVVGAVGAVLQRFNPRWEEAALSLGASRPATFLRVTLPLIMPGVYAGALYAFVASFGDIPVALFLVGERYTTFPVEIFHAIEFDFNPAMLSVSTLVILFSLGILLLIQRIVDPAIILGARRAR